MALGSTQPLTEMSTRCISWGVKAAGTQGWQPYHHPVPLWNLGTLTSWNPLGHYRPVTGLLLYALVSKVSEVYETNPAFHWICTGTYFPWDKVAGGWSRHNFDSFKHSRTAPEKHPDFNLTLDMLAVNSESSKDSTCLYEGRSISKLQIVIEKRRMGIMTYKQHLFFNVISKQI